MRGKGTALAAGEGETKDAAGYARFLDELKTRIRDARVRAALAVNRELVKDPYHFDFLALGPEARERDLERALLGQVRDFLLELGVGFALVGSQQRLEVGGQDFYLDLLFYHLRLRCYVVVDLKLGAFRPEDSGKMSFYLTAVDESLRRGDDGATIGLILCRERNRVVAEYALRGVERPIGVAEYRLTEHLPPRLRESLPSAAALERELARMSPG